MPDAASDTRTIDEAVRAHLRAHGLPEDGGETSRWFTIRLGPIGLRLPNPQTRRKVLFLHDINHLVTGYNTVFSEGELLIGAFEIGGGCGPYAAAWFFNLGAMAWGVLIRPRELWHAFRRGRHADSIYRRPVDRARYRAMTVAEMHRFLGLARPTPPPTPRDRAAFAFWCVMSWVFGLALISVVLGAAALAALGAWTLIATLLRS